MISVADFDIGEVPSHQDVLSAVRQRLVDRGVDATKRFLAGEELSEGDKAAMGIAAGVRYETRSKGDGLTEFITERVGFAVVDGKVKVVTLQERKGKSVRFARG